MSDQRKAFGEIWTQLERRVRRTRIVVVLLGAGNSGLSTRRKMARALRRRGFAALVPEDDLPRTLGPSVAEQAVLSAADTDLVFVQVESWGSATEFSQLRALPEVAQKLRVLVPTAHHPIYGHGRGYLSDAYLTHLSVYGHVYAVGKGGRLRIPEPEDLIIRLSERYRQIRAFGIK